jgi:hypothetical protein
MRQIIYQNIFVFVIYILFFWFQNLTFFPIQNKFQNSTIALGAASLVFLPHGVRVLSYVLFGPKIFYGLFLAHFITGLSIGLRYFDVLILSLFSTLCALIAIKIYSGTWHLKNIKIFNFKFIIYVSFIAALINSLSVNTYKLLQGSNFSELYSSQIFQFIIGDVVGTIVLFYLFLFSKKVIKGSFN